MKYSFISLTAKTESSKLDELIEVKENETKNVEHANDGGNVMCQI